MKNLKLMVAEGNLLNEKEMISVRGGKQGRACGCACYYRNTGGSSVEANRDANYAGGEHGLFSPKMNIKGAQYKADYPEGGTGIW
ncbi:MAG: hypothetical protein IKZ71_02210 [Bacteroidales bacterium]|nr:hypothetical protein [Bacteroidales bacterium]